MVKLKDEQLPYCTLLRSSAVMGVMTLWALIFFLSLEWVIPIKYCGYIKCYE